MKEFRRATVSDIDIIHGFECLSMPPKELLKHLLNTALSATLVYEEGQFIGFYTFHGTFIQDGKFNDLESQLNSNTLVLTAYAAHSQEILIDSLAFIVRQVFSTFRKIYTLLLPQLKVEDSSDSPLESIFKSVYYENDKYVLKACEKNQLHKLVKIRKAKIEDCDDIVPLFEKMDLLKDQRSDFQMAKWLEPTSRTELSLVAHIGSKIIGFIHFTSNVNTEFATENFQIEAFASVDDFYPFAIKLFCMEDEYLQEATMFLEPAFNHFKEDYCIMTLPTHCLENPLTRQLTSVPSKFPQTQGFSLFITNRYAVNEYATIERLGKSDDMDQFIHLVTNTPEGWIDQLKSRIATDKDFYCFGIKHTNQWVGFIGFELINDTQLYSEQFNIQDFVLLDGMTRIAKLNTYVLNPLFLSQTPWIFQQLFINTHLGAVIHLPELIDEPWTNATLHSWLVPVQRRRRIEFPNQQRDGTLVANDIASHAQIMTPALLWKNIEVCHHRVVVVGASDTGTSFLEQLIYHPSHNFRNLFIISPTGPTDNHLEATSQECYNHSELQQLGLNRYATHIPSKVRLIDTQNNLLKLQDDTFFSFDFLILTHGLEFSARYLSEELATLKGVISFNQQEWTNAKDYLERAASGPIVVYGRDLQALSLVGFLAEELEPQQRSRIMYVSPSPPFVPEDAFTKVLDYMQQLGIVVHFSTRLSSWEKENGQLAHLSFENKTTNDLIQCACSNLIYVDVKVVDHHIYDAIDECALVYDGKLVIDAHFRTSDPNIYAAGPGTKFKSEYRSNWLLEFCDSRETGEKLASHFLSTSGLLPSLESEQKIMTFKLPKKLSAKLPGGYYYFSMAQPQIPWSKMEDDGRHLVTNVKNGAYFSIDTDNEGYIRSIVHLDKSQGPYRNYQSLYGRHEKYLNRLVARYDEENAGIQDLKAFLNDTTVLGIYYDRFDHFTKDILEKLKSTQISHWIERTKQEEGEWSQVIYRWAEWQDWRKPLDQKTTQYLIETNIVTPDILQTHP